MTKNRKLETASDYMRAYPRLTSHLICHSLGYALPTVAASIVQAAHERKLHYCEWIDACYNGAPVPAVHQAITGRHHHHGYMADYAMAKALVDRAIASGQEPELASWF